jgi:hypothetical protein
MSRMIDLIRASALPSNLMQSAAKGSLSVPPRETIEILVYLAVHNKVFGPQAQLTLAGWDEASSRVVASESTTSKEVLDYLISPKNLRPVLLPALLGNPSVSEESLVQLAPSAGREVAEVMLKSERVTQSPRILNALRSNPHLTGIQSESMESVRNKLGPSAPAPKAPVAEPAPAVEAAPAAEAALEKLEGGLDEVFHLAPTDQAQDAEQGLDEGVFAYLSEHAKEIAAEADHPFQPIGGFYDEFVPSSEEPRAEATAPAAATAVAGAAAVKAPTTKKPRLSPGPERGSALQKISKLDIRGRIQLAMKGSKEERSLLIRDGTKIVALAVLESPKVSDGEVEKFASQKNLLEAVLRGIPMKRRFAKNYAVLRNLVFNPRTPLDVSLALMKNMLIGDLRNLSGNKEVSDTVRKLATKMFKQKMQSSGKP